MKQKINIILGFLLLSICIYGQKQPVYTGMEIGANARNIPSYKLTPEWKKHKKYQAWGWTTFGVGSAMMIVGFMGNVIDNWEQPSPRYRFMVLGFTGVAVTAASVPLFVFSIKNKKKARSLRLGSGYLPCPLQNGSGIQSRPALSMGIDF
mgnify:CR=1 FL=1